MALLGNALKNAFSSACTGGVGAFFVPASTAAAGGLLNVMGACAIGGAVVAPFAGILTSVTGISALANSHFKKRNYGLAAFFGALTAAELLIAALIAAEIGAAALGIPAYPVFICSLVGSAVITASTFLLSVGVIFGLACIYSAIISDSEPSMSEVMPSCAL
ncbi:MAG: hypothetical protein K0U37_02520 [Gammaproteobacteria bacterium]|nr:hypothetical protein [Gammaproteobacteria bacterium]